MIGEIQKAADAMPQRRRSQLCRVVLPVTGTMITLLSYFSMEGERLMEQTRKLGLSPTDLQMSNEGQYNFIIIGMGAGGRTLA
jgi:hypothetical protein